jgi:hypothetical protein
MLKLDFVFLDAVSPEKIGAFSSSVPHAFILQSITLE